jgi:hypothetical protein
MKKWQAYLERGTPDAEDNRVSKDLNFSTRPLEFAKAIMTIKLSFDDGRNKR